MNNTENIELASSLGVDKRNPHASSKPDLEDGFVFRFFPSSPSTATHVFRTVWCHDKDESEKLPCQQKAHTAAQKMEQHVDSLIPTTPKAAPLLPGFKCCHPDNASDWDGFFVATSTPARDGFHE